MAPEPQAEGLTADDRADAPLALPAPGPRAALDRLLPLVYRELRRIARRQLARERPGHTFDSVALVNEAFLSFAKRDELVLNDRVHFLALAANVMRRILVDHARARRTAKRGGGAHFTVEVPGQRPIDAEGLLALDRALERLAVIDAQAARLVEQRYFAGATEEETSRALGLSPATIRRRWAFAKAWLQRELTEPRV